VTATQRRARRERIRFNARKRRARWVCRQLDRDARARGVTKLGLYFGRDGRPLTLGQWSYRIELGIDKRVAWTWVDERRHVSTVWLGLDHGFGGERAIFESMLFERDSYAGLERWRYATEAEALAGHEAMVRRARDGEFAVACDADALDVLGPAGEGSG